MYVCLILELSLLLKTMKRLLFNLKQENAIAINLQYKIK